MKDFDGITFGGTFRPYQKRVLDNCNKYYSNNKLHIVAAPGSGKTILGLELIARQKSPCLILSPTNTIKYQWGERFADFYLPKNQKIEDYVSYDLNNVKLLTSITYQALHSAIDKIETEDEEEKIDYSKIDLFKLINDYGIKTICVDEAHHLQNEWQKALEKFISGLKKGIKIIALTATPPYDASKAEWDRYIKVCGQIDEEIYVTELVKAKNLCPHQDYIYFNYPTLEEQETLTNYKHNVALMLNEFKNLPLLNNVLNSIAKIVNLKQDVLPEDAKKISNVLCLLNYFGFDVTDKICLYFSRCKTIACYSDNKFENAVQFLLDGDLVGETQKAEIKALLKKYGLVQRNKVYFELGESLKKKLITSLGKLDSICNITKSEYENLNNNLRELILTDYIKKEDVKLIGTNENFTTISIVSIFENLRRQNDNLTLGVLSGELCILPNHLENEIREKHKLKTKLVCKKLNNTNYSVFDFKLPNKEKVKIVGEMFASGKINVLVGTKSLLGEGWDSPSINCLILASFVGSFMLSNQMRGRAIRVDKNSPQKTANIWHLVTLEPNYDVTELKYDRVVRNIEESEDYATLKRRFNCFVGPNYKTGAIESGIQRVGLLQTEYSKQEVEKINSHNLAFANNRQNLFNTWGLNNVEDTSLYASTIINNDRCFKGIKNTHLVLLILSVILSVGALGVLIHSLNVGINSAITCMMFILGMASLDAGAYFCFINLKRFICYANMTVFVKKIAGCMLNTLVQMKLVNQFSTLKFQKEDGGVKIILKGQNTREQTVFQNTISEFFEEPNDVRYLIVKKNFIGTYNYKYTLKCPDVFANNKENVKNFCDHLRQKMGGFCGIYAKSELGKNVLIKTYKSCYINEDSKKIVKKLSL